jgi:hypothetical protein
MAARYLTFSPWIWVTLLGLTVIAIIFAIPSKFYSVKALRAIVLIPGIFVKMFLLLFKLRGANKTFIHTPHGIDAQPSNAEKV